MKLSYREHKEFMMDLARGRTEPLEFYHKCFLCRQWEGKANFKKISDKLICKDCVDNEENIKFKIEEKVLMAI